MQVYKKVAKFQRLKFQHQNILIISQLFKLFLNISWCATTETLEICQRLFDNDNENYEKLKWQHPKLWTPVTKWINSPWRTSGHRPATYCPSASDKSATIKRRITLYLAFCIVCAKSRNLRIKESKPEQTTLQPYRPVMDARMWAILACLFAVASAEIITEQNYTAEINSDQNYTEPEEVPHNETSERTASELIQDANNITSKSMTWNYS